MSVTVATSISNTVSLQLDGPEAPAFIVYNHASVKHCWILHNIQYIYGMSLNPGMNQIYSERQRAASYAAASHTQMS